MGFSYHVNFPGPPSPNRATRVAWILVFCLAIGNGVLLWERSKPIPESVNQPAVPARPVRFQLQLPDGVTLALGRGPSVAVSADGTHVAFRGEADGVPRLYAQSLDRMAARPIAGSEGGQDPFFSPDGRWIGFFSDEKLKKIHIDGGIPVTIADAPNPRGSTWAEDDHIYLAPRNNTGIWRVPATGGRLEPITTISDGQLSHRWPQVTADGKALVYTIWNDTGWDTGRIVWHPLDGSASRVLHTGGFGRVVEQTPGQYSLVYVDGQSVKAMPFDIAAGSTTGADRVMVDVVYTNNSGGAHLDISRTGSLAYLTGASGSPTRDVIWRDRAGRPTAVGTLTGTTRLPSLSPDGTKLAYYKEERGTRDVWMYDLRTRDITRLTSQQDSTAAEAPLMISPPAIAWSPNGTSVTYAHGTPANLYRVAARPAATPERLTTSPHAQIPGSFTPDGRTLAFIELDALSGRDIWLASLDGDRWQTRPFLRTPFNETSPAISPDGRWLAYASNETGRFEVYVQPFPAGGRRLQVTTGGGALPQWAQDGHEILFVSDSGTGQLMSARLGPESTITSRQALFETTGYDRWFGITPNRILMTTMTSPLGAASAVTMVLNWRAELAAATVQP